MTNHPNRNWRSRWRVNLSAGCATHIPTGITVTFNGGDGKCRDLDRLNEMIRSGAIKAGHVARLMREAGDIYQEKLNDT